MRFEPTSNSAAEHRLRGEILGLFEAPGNTTVEDVLRGWLRQPDVEAAIVPTFSDEHGDQEGIGFGFRRGQGEHFVVSVPLEDIRAQYPDIRPFSDFLVFGGALSDPMLPFEVESDRLEKMFDIDRADIYDEGLCGDVLKFGDALAYAIMFGLTPGSTVIISEREADTFEDSEDPDWKYAGKRILSVDITYQHTAAATRHSVPGFNESFYTVIE